MGVLLTNADRWAAALYAAAPDLVHAVLAVVGGAWLLGLTYALGWALTDGQRRS
jgi:hypothetical protein